jgi:hypothetical protein
VYEVQAGRLKQLGTFHPEERPGPGTNGRYAGHNPNEGVIA